MRFSKSQIRDSMSDPQDLELDKAHKIYYALKKDVKKGNRLTGFERNHFCYFESLGTRKKIDGFNVLDYSICNDFWFMESFSEYWSDLHGLYEHQDRLTKEKFSKSKIQSDIKRLNLLAEEWEPIIKRSDHSSQILNDISKETRKEIKDLKAEPIFSEYGFFRECRNFEHRKRIILLRSKYIFLFTNEIFEYGDVDYFELNLGSKIIEYNPYSLIHILSRHFEVSIKQTDREKSLYTDRLEPRKIFNILEIIFDNINGIDSTRVHPRKIYINYKGLICTIWIETKNKSLPKIGNVKFNRIATFYPTEKQSELDDIGNNYTGVEIDNELTIYLMN